MYLSEISNKWDRKRNYGIGSFIILLFCGSHQNLQWHNSKSIHPHPPPTTTATTITTHPNHHTHTHKACSFGINKESDCCWCDIIVMDWLQFITSWKDPLSEWFVVKLSVILIWPSAIFDTNHQSLMQKSKVECLASTKRLGNLFSINTRTNRRSVDWSEITR